MRRFLAALTLLLIMTHPLLADDDLQDLPLFANPADKIDPNADHIRMVKVTGKNKQTTLFLWGAIESGDSVRFKQALAQTPKPISEILIIGSPGGALEEGLQIGRIIHDNKLATHIPGDGQCISACNFIFLGGLIRTVDVGGQFITHFFNNDTAPLILLSDENQALEALPPADPAAAPTQTASNGAPPPQTQTDTVGRLGPPQPSAHLSSLGCSQMAQIYTHDTDQRVQRQVIGFEKDEDPSAVKLETEHVQSAADLARLRALTMDYLCVAQDVAKTSAEIVQFLIEMRLSVRFFDEFANISNALPQTMTRNQLRDFNITNMD